MNEIAIFYHLYQVNNWQDLFEEQMNKIRSTGLLGAADFIHIGINGDQPVVFNVEKNHTIKHNPIEFFDGEMQTLSDLYDFCCCNKDYKVLYFHSKGISTHTTEYGSNVEFWRKYMEKFNIENWEKCCQLLNDYDCVGTEWETEMLLGGQTFIAPCYAGTFWWATAEYISRLDRDFLFTDVMGMPGTRRYQSEFWIGSGKPNHYNFYNSNKNKYYSAVMPEEYEQFI